MLLVTTHMSDEHIWYLKLCWPEALQHSLLLRNADVIVYMSLKANENEEEEESEDEEDAEKRLNDNQQLLQQTFLKDQKVTIHSKENLGYWAGSTGIIE